MARRKQACLTWSMAFTMPFTMPVWKVRLLLVVLVLGSLALWGCHRASHCAEESKSCAVAGDSASDQQCVTSSLLIAQKSGAVAHSSLSVTQAGAATGGKPASSSPSSSTCAADDGTEPVLAPCPPGAASYLERASRFYDHGKFEDAWSCAAQAVALETRQADALSVRAAAQAALGRYEEARMSYARALSLNPDHFDALLGAADLYLSRLPVSRDHTELGLAYASRGRRLAEHVKNRSLAGQFALLESSALNDLGRNKEALQEAKTAMTTGVDQESARFEMASALWNLCRFDEAKAEFEKLQTNPERSAYAHHYLGLIAERQGKEAVATQEMALARKLLPEDFVSEVPITGEEFTQLLTKIVAAIPKDMRRDLETVKITAQDLPDLEDLLASDPPLSPSIIGLFRGPPLGESCPEPRDQAEACRSIVLYRRNLAHAVRDREEFEKQTRVTLLHEIGHLRGEDDAQLAARGLE